MSQNYIRTVLQSKSAIEILPIHYLFRYVLDWEPELGRYAFEPFKQSIVHAEKISKNEWNVKRLS